MEKNHKLLNIKRNAELIFYAKFMSVFTQKCILPNTKKIRNIFYDFYSKMAATLKPLCFGSRCSSREQKHYTECFYFTQRLLYIWQTQCWNFCTPARKAVLWREWMAGSYNIGVAHCFVHTKFSKRRRDSREPLRRKNSLVKYGMMELVGALQTSSLDCGKYAGGADEKFPLLCEARFLPITFRRKMSSVARVEIVLLL